MSNENLLFVQRNKFKIWKQHLIQQIQGSKQIQSDISLPKVLRKLNNKIKIISGFALVLFSDHLIYLVVQNAA